MKTQGLFGPIEVVRTGRNQQLRINGQNQGGAYLAPPASVVDPSLPADAPGPASSSPYAVGWLISGVCHPSASGVMIGLGSGSGATQLLHEFPGIDLTILEIDPEVTRLATAAFPLLDYYADQGRLNIIETDAEDWLEAHTDGFQFALADAYTGEARLLDHYLEQLCRRAGSITLNVIDTLGGRSMTNVLRILEEQGKPVQHVFRASHLGLGLNVEDGQPSNWIVTTCPTTPAELAAYEPFADVEGIGAYLTRLQWDQLLSLNVSGVGAVGRVVKAAALQQGGADRVDRPELGGDSGDTSPTPDAVNPVRRHLPRRIVNRQPNPNLIATDTYDAVGTGRERAEAGLPLFNRAYDMLPKKRRTINPQQAYGPETVIDRDETGPAYYISDHRIVMPTENWASTPVDRTPFVYAHELAHYHDPVFDHNNAGIEMDRQAQVAAGHDHHEVELPAMVTENVAAIRHGHTDPYELADHAPARQGAWIYNHMLRYGPQIPDARARAAAPTATAPTATASDNIRETVYGQGKHRELLQRWHDHPEPRAYSRAELELVYRGLTPQRGSHPDVTSELNSIERELARMGATGTDIIPDDSAEIGRWMRSLRDTEGNSKLHRMYMHWLRTQRDAPIALRQTAPAPAWPSFLSRINRRAASAVELASVSRSLGNKIFPESARERAQQFLREEHERAEARQGGTAK